MEAKTKNLTIGQKKKKLLEYRDFWGGDIMETDDIENVKTDNDIREIINKHSYFLQMQLSDALSDLENFKKSLNLEM